ncbi:MAG: hypothetical protein AB7V46_05475, partial [Thermomicrobiales bacterium]
LFPLSAAISVYLLFHLALAGFGAFALARISGIGPLGALTAGIAYELSGPVFSRSVCCPAQLQVVSWVPVVLIGIEMALQRDRWASRLRWMTLSAFAMSQVVASWIGQGSYYVALLAGAFVVYRSVLDPFDRARGRHARVVDMFGCGLGVAIITAGFSAAGVIPRLDFNEVSNVAGGRYHNAQITAAVSGGWQAGDTFFREVTTDPYYMGSVVIALAVIGPLLARGRLLTPFFAFVLVAGFVMSASIQTPLHTFFYAILPRFEDFHRHWPERIAMAGFIAIAMLAGAAVDALPGWLAARRKAVWVAVIPAVIAGAFAVFLSKSGDALPLEVYAGVALVVATVVIIAYSVSHQRATLTTVAMVMLLTAELSIANAGMARTGPYGGYFDVDLDAYFSPSNAGQYLIGLQREETFRYFGFDPRLEQIVGGWPVFYRYQFGNERTRSIVVNNRATLHGLHDIQGYNPVQLQAYVDYMTLLNGEAQDYHDENVLPAGLESPLLDVLNVRYFVVRSEATSEGDPLLLSLSRTYETVFDDGFTKVLIRPDALPRAWIVHEAVQAEGMDAAAMVADGLIDPATTASLDSAPPALQPPGSSPENVTIQEYQSERITLRTETASDGILLLSEVDYPAWKATIDGVPVEVHSAFGLIRAVVLPAGTHSVEFFYDTSAEMTGLKVTAFTVLAVVFLTAGLSLRSRGSDRNGFFPPESAVKMG